MVTVTRIPIWLRNLLITMILLSNIVLVEPSPFDFLFFLLMLLSLLLSFVHYQKNTMLPMIILLLFLFSNLLSLLFAVDLLRALFFLLITMYLAVLWVIVVGVLTTFGEQSVKPLLVAYTVTGVVSACIGVMAYFDLIPFTEQLLMFGRAKGFFKDPNVYGPFLVVPAIFSLYLLENERQSFLKIAGITVMFLLLVFGMILSFSRAAWMNLAVSIVLYLVLMKKEWLRVRIRTILIILGIGIPMLLFFIQIPAIEELFRSRLSIQGYDDNRFDTQKEAFVSGVMHPLGIGPGQSEMVFKISPHSLYARILAENGLFGLLTFCLFLVGSLLTCFQQFRQSYGASSIYFAFVFATIFGHVLNSFFVDTLHWRHFWLLLALAWVPITTNRGH